MSSHIRPFWMEFAPGPYKPWHHHKGWRSDCVQCARTLKFDWFKPIGDLGPSEMAPIWAMQLQIRRLTNGLAQAARVAGVTSL